MRPRTVARAVVLGVIVSALVSVGAGDDSPQALKVLYGFDSPPADLLSELLEGSDGALHGTTRVGGVYSAGTIFKVNRDGTGFLKLHDFHPR